MCCVGYNHAHEMALRSGTKLGPYEIQSPLGAGGMGEVYRARDTRLGRDVAIKVLPEALSHDAERPIRPRTANRNPAPITGVDAHVKLRRSFNRRAQFSR